MLRASLFALAAMVMTAGAAQADVIYGGSTSFLDSTSGNNVDFTLFSGGAINNSSLATLQAVGSNVTVTNFLTLHTTFTGTTAQTDSLSITLNFSQPNTQSVTLTGTGTETKAGSSYIGALAFSATQLISFADGEILRIGLSQVSAPSSSNSSLSLALNASFSVVQAASAVPVPASVALFGSGLLGFLALRRRQSSGSLPTA
jgi:hypothetical protein